MHVASKRESWTVRETFPRTCDFEFSDVYETLSCFAGEKRRIEAHMLRKWKLIGGEPDVKRMFLICGSYAFPVDGGAKRASIAIAIDGSNMPVGYHDMQGKLEPRAFREAICELKERLGAGRVVVVAGGLRDIDPTIAEVSATGDGFVLYQRNFVEQSSLAAWARDEEEYLPMGGDVFMKERTIGRRMPGGNTVEVKEVVLRGGGYATSQSHALLVSSELDMTATEIVQIYRELWRQAEPFQPLEADFSSMPYPTPAEDHIAAHFSVCYAAFFALRLLRWKMGWRFNAANTADALLRMEGTHLQRNYYLFNYRSQVTDCIEEAVNLDKARRLRTRSDLRSVPGIVKRSFNQLGS